MRSTGQGEGASSPNSPSIQRATPRLAATKNTAAPQRDEEGIEKGEPEREEGELLPDEGRHAVGELVLRGGKKVEIRRGRLLTSEAHPPARTAPIRRVQIRELGGRHCLAEHRQRRPTDTSMRAGPSRAHLDRLLVRVPHAEEEALPNLAQLQAAHLRTTRKGKG